MRLSIVVLSGLLVGACGAEDELTLSARALTIDNKIAANKLVGNKIAANKLASNKIAANKLVGNKIAANKIAAADLIATPEGREVLKVLVGCALPDGVTLVGEVAGDGYEFPGQIGLAGEWTDRPLDEVEKRWVSACVFARVNAHEVSVLVSLRGPHPALEVGADEAVGWTAEEGAFYGNLFTLDGAPIDWNACRGRDQAAGESGDLVNRDCAEPDPANPGLTLCGFRFAGDCGRFAPRRACKRFSRSGTHYRQCFDRAIQGAGQSDEDQHDDDHLGHPFRQVITTYVRP